MELTRDESKYMAERLIKGSKNLIEVIAEQKIKANLSGGVRISIFPDGKYSIVYCEDGFRLDNEGRCIDTEELENGERA